MSPFLDSSLHIRWSTLTPDAIVPDITAALADAEARVDAVCRTDRGRMTFENTFLANIAEHEHWPILTPPRPHPTRFAFLKDCTLQALGLFRRP